MRFAKMHGLGNDYLYVYGEVPADIETLSRKLSDRHFGAGSDGMIFISPSKKADFKMRIFNADGSEGKMCGNGIRCVGKYVFEKGYTDKRQLAIETLSGIRTLDMSVSRGKVRSVTVDMGPAAAGGEMELSVDGQKVSGTPVSVGNPHFVLFVDDMEKAPLLTLGPCIERCEAFPEGVNVEFVQVLGDRSLRMRVWERGSGVTMACGTGACAAAAAAVRRGYVRPGGAISVVLDGGTLQIALKEDGTALMTGPAEWIYEGETLI
ncbi:MAG: diaminopimelate epimerase [Lachnospiraceae bacterium]|nr:diaminopimelate epimerase [Lachnospiraceae bacterium]